ncbi:MAG TPA: hypothetical protein DIU07_17040 [Rhodobacteraceae bacterium]|nr:hypothetical protein [Paracoccaceae bacterium]
MTIEGENDTGTWPPIGRYLGFVFLTMVLSIAIFVASQFTWGRDLGIGAFFRLLLEALGYGAIVWMPMALLAVLPGLWVFRRLFSALCRRSLPIGFAVIVPSMTVFLLGAVGIVPFGLRNTRVFMKVVQFSGITLLHVAPVAAMSGLILLRPSRRTP